DKLERHLAARFETGKKIAAAKNISRGLKPAIGESSLEIFYRRPFYAYIGVAPVFRRAAVAQPIVADAITAGETDASVDDEDAAVIAIVILQEFPRQDDLGCSHPPKMVELTAGLAHDLQDLVGGFAAAVIIQQDINLD